MFRYEHERRQRTVTYHDTPLDCLVDDATLQPNTHLIFQPGLTPAQRRSMLRDLERQQRKLNAVKIESDWERRRREKKEIDQLNADEQISEVTALKQKAMMITSRIEARADHQSMVHRRPIPQLDSTVEATPFKQREKAMVSALDTSTPAVTPNTLFNANSQTQHVQQSTATGTPSPSSSHVSGHESTRASADRAEREGKGEEERAAENGTEVDVNGSVDAAPPPNTTSTTTSKPTNPDAAKHGDAGLVDAIPADVDFASLVVAPKARVDVLGDQQQRDAAQVARRLSTTSSSAPPASSGPAISASSAPTSDEKNTDTQQPSSSSVIPSGVHPTGNANVTATVSGRGSRTASSVVVVSETDSHVTPTKSQVEQQVSLLNRVAIPRPQRRPQIDDATGTELPSHGAVSPVKLPPTRLIPIGNQFAPRPATDAEDKPTGPRVYPDDASFGMQVAIVEDASSGRDHRALTTTNDENENDGGVSVAGRGMTRLTIPAVADIDNSGMSRHASREGSPRLSARERAAGISPRLQGTTSVTRLTKLRGLPAPSQKKKKPAVVVDLDSLAP